MKTSTEVLYDANVLDLDRHSWMSLRRSDGDLIACVLADSVRTRTMRCAEPDNIEKAYMQTDYSVVVENLSLEDTEMWLRLVTENEAKFLCAMRYLSFDDGMWRDKTAVFPCSMDGLEIYSAWKPWMAESERGRPFTAEIKLEARDDETEFAYVSDLDSLENFEMRHSRSEAKNIGIYI